MSTSIKSMKPSLLQLNRPISIHLRSNYLKLSEWGRVMAQISHFLAGSGTSPPVVAGGMPTKKKEIFFLKTKYWSFKKFIGVQMVLQGVHFRSQIYNWPQFAPRDRF